MIWICQMSNKRRFDLDSRFKRSVESEGGYLSASKLKWQLLTKKRGSSTQGIPAGKEHLAWVTNTVTLISGERDAILVDTFLSAQQSRELLDWVLESGENLVTIYVTHAHGDHFFGLKLLLDRFPNAKAVATAPVVASIQNQITPDFMRSFWEPRFPGQLPSQLTAPEVLDGDIFYLEGEALKVVELGHTDTSHSTALHVPSIGLVISGDCVYNDTHLYLGECDAESRNEWLRALENRVAASKSCRRRTRRARSRQLAAPHR